MNGYRIAVGLSGPKFFWVVLLVCLAALPAYVEAEKQPPSASDQDLNPIPSAGSDSQAQAEQGQETAETEAVNINAATPATLASQLKGIGPSKAAAIVQYREKHGAFVTVDALVNVKGIGIKTLERLRKRLIAGPFKIPEKGETLAEQETAAQDAVQSIVKRSLEIRRAARDKE